MGLFGYSLFCWKLKIIKKLLFMSVALFTCLNVLFVFINSVRGIKKKKKKSNTNAGHGKRHFPNAHIASSHAQRMSFFFVLFENLIYTLIKQSKNQ